MKPDLNKLTKSELKKLLKKEKKKKKKAKVKAKAKTKTKHTHRTPINDEFVKQKPIIAMTNPQQPPTYSQTGFNNSSASMEQRNTDIMKGQLNEQSNKLIGEKKKHENEVENHKINEQKGMDEHNRKMDKFKNSQEKAERLRREKQEKQELREKGKSAQSNTIGNSLSNPISHNMGRDSYVEPDYFNPSDNIDVPETSGELHGIDESFEDVKEDVKEDVHDDINREYFESLNLKQLKNEAKLYELDVTGKQAKTIRKILINYLNS